MTKTYIGIDNGVTGSIGIITPERVIFFPIPTKKELSYTKTKQFISRIDNPILCAMLFYETNNAIAILERPMVNPTRFKATGSALRALESTMICLESLSIPIIFIDSKEWQKELLPAGLKGDELKKASIDIASRLFPNWRKEIEKQGDGDALLIAEYARRKNL